MGKLKQETNKIYHPKSRKAEQLHRAATHNERVIKQKKKSTKTTKPLQIRFLWFHEKVSTLQKENLKSKGLPEDYPQSNQKFCYSDTQIHQLIQNYLEEKAIENTKSTIRSLVELTENEEYNSTGIELPDFSQPKAVNAFLSWNLDPISKREADVRFLGLRKYKKSDSEVVNSTTNGDGDVEL